MFSCPSTLIVSSFLLILFIMFMWLFIHIRQQPVDIQAFRDIFIKHILGLNLWKKISTNIYWSVLKPIVICINFVRILCPDMLTKTFCVVNCNITQNCCCDITEHYIVWKDIISFIHISLSDEPITANIDHNLSLSLANCDIHTVYANLGYFFV